MKAISASRTACCIGPATDGPLAPSDPWRPLATAIDFGVPIYPMGVGFADRPVVRAVALRFATSCGSRQLDRVRKGLGIGHTPRTGSIWLAVCGCRTLGPLRPLGALWRPTGEAGTPHPAVPPARLWRPGASWMPRRRTARAMRLYSGLASQDIAAKRSKVRRLRKRVTTNTATPY